MCLQSVPAMQQREGSWDSYTHPTPISTSWLVSHICKENILKWPHASQLLSSSDTFLREKEKGGKTTEPDSYFQSLWSPI